MSSSVHGWKPAYCMAAGPLLEAGCQARLEQVLCAAAVHQLFIQLLLSANSRLGSGRQWKNYSATCWPILRHLARGANGSPCGTRAVRLPGGSWEAAIYCVHPGRQPPPPPNIPRCCFNQLTNKGNTAACSKVAQSRHGQRRDATQRSGGAVVGARASFRWAAANCLPADRVWCLCTLLIANCSGCTQAIKPLPPASGLQLAILAAAAP